MNQVIFTGTVTNAIGCAVTITLYQGLSIIWTHHYFNSFSFPYPLSSNNYDVTISGITQGNFEFEITGAIKSINPSVPCQYKQKISGSFDFDV